VPVLDYGTGPTEYGCDVIEITAETKRDAIALGVREMLRAPYGDFARNGSRFKWCRDARNDGYNPYAGVRAERAEQ
jgi:hypothetical protein